MRPIGPSNIKIKYGEKWYAPVIGVVMVLAWAVVFGLQLGSGAKNEDIQLIDEAGSSGHFNYFEVYTFKNNQHRCFVAVKQDGNIDLDCP